MFVDPDSRSLEEAKPHFGLESELDWGTVFGLMSVSPYLSSPGRVRPLIDISDLYNLNATLKKKKDCQHFSLN